jgi:hypothetical protein
MALVRHNENPFCENLVIPTKGKRVTVSRLGKDDNVLVNQTTGEVHGTHITTYKQVDSKEFVKVFAQNIALTFDLTSAGLKSLNVMIWALQYQAINKDLLQLESLTLASFLEDHKNSKLKLSLATFNRGLRELVKSQILAAYSIRGFYFINPNFVFNGNRIVFSTAIELKKKREDQLEIDCGQ